jgi:hypothetical protein
MLSLLRCSSYYILRYLRSDVGWVWGLVHVLQNGVAVLRQPKENLVLRFLPILLRRDAPTCEIRYGIENEAKEAVNQWNRYEGCRHTWRPNRNIGVNPRDMLKMDIVEGRQGRDGSPRQKVASMSLPVSRAALRLCARSVANRTPC